MVGFLCCREVHKIAQHRVECERKAFNVIVKLVESNSAADGELEEVVRGVRTQCDGWQ